MTILIKEGAVPVKWESKIKCQKDDEHDKDEPCGAILKITEEDLVLRFWKGTHFPKYYTAVKCPCCNKYNRVRNIPHNIRERTSTEEKQKNASFDGFGEYAY